MLLINYKADSNSNIAGYNMRFMKKRKKKDKNYLDQIDLKKRARQVLKASINLVQQRWSKPGRPKHSATSIYIYEIRPRADKNGFDLSGDALSYSPLWYRGSNAIRDAIRFAKFNSRSHAAVIRVYDTAGNVIETHEQVGELKDPRGE